MDESNNNSSQVLIDVRCSVFEDVDSIEFNGELSTEQHQKEKEVENEKRPQILFLLPDQFESISEAILNRC